MNLSSIVKRIRWKELGRLYLMIFALLLITLAIGVGVTALSILVLSGYEDKLALPSLLPITAFSFTIEQALYIIIAGLGAVVALFISTVYRFGKLIYVRNHDI